MSCGRSYQKEVSEMAKVQLSTRTKLIVLLYASDLHPILR
jgi:hypothetical protein